MADRGSTVYLEYIRAQIADQDARKESIERRGLAVVTTSGTIVSLLFGLVAVLTGVEKYELPSAAEVWVGLALVAFVVSSVGGIATNLPLVYRSVEISGLRRATASMWGDEPAKAEKKVAETDIDVLEKAKSLNSLKGWLLFGAIAVQLLAVVFLAIAVAVILDHG